MIRAILCLLVLFLLTSRPCFVSLLKAPDPASDGSAHTGRYEWMKQVVVSALSHITSFVSSFQLPTHLPTQLPTRSPTATPLCNTYKIKAKANNKVQAGKTLKIKIGVGNTLKRIVLNTEVTISLPNGVAFVSGSVWPKTGRAPRAVGQTVVAGLVSLKARGSGQVTLAVSIPRNAQGTLSFPIAVEDPNRNCVDRFLLQVSVC
jgi:hypothetical protein